MTVTVTTFLKSVFKMCFVQWSRLVHAPDNKSYLSFLPVPLKCDSIRTLRCYTFPPPWGHEPSVALCIESVRTITVLSQTLKPLITSLKSSELWRTPARSYCLQSNVKCWLSGFWSVKWTWRQTNFFLDKTDCTVTDFTDMRLFLFYFKNALIAYCWISIFVRRMWVFLLNA